MFDKVDIIARLQAGETMDEIVEAITTTINEAESEYRIIQEEQEKLAQADAEMERAHAAKREAILVMLDGLCDYLVASGEDEFLKELHDVDEARIMEILDSSIKLTKSLSSLKAVEFADSPFDMFVKMFA